MSDQEEIRNLLARYSHCADDDDMAGYQSLFTSDGELVSDDIVVPAAQLPTLMTANKQMKDSQEQPFGSKHLQMNTAIKVNGDAATAVTDILIIALRAKTGWAIGGSGRYNDELVKQNGEWKIRRRKISWYKNTGSEMLEDSSDNTVRGLMRDAAAG